MVNEQLIYEIITQLGIGGFALLIFYKYATIVTNKVMNGMTKKMDSMLDKQDRILGKLEHIAEKFDKMLLVEELNKAIIEATRTVKEIKEVVKNND